MEPTKLIDGVIVDMVMVAAVANGRLSIDEVVGGLNTYEEIEIARILKSRPEQYEDVDTRDDRTQTRIVTHEHILSQLLKCDIKKANRIVEAVENPDIVTTVFGVVNDCNDCGAPLSKGDRKTKRCRDCNKLHVASLVKERTKDSRNKGRTCALCTVILADATSVLCVRCWKTTPVQIKRQLGLTQRSAIKCKECDKTLARKTKTMMCIDCLRKSRKDAAHKCQDCGKQIGSGNARCKPCSSAYFEANKSKCLDCGKSVDSKAKRCRPCYEKTIGEPGRCLDCRKVVKRKAKRCWPCHSKSLNERTSSGD